MISRYSEQLEGNVGRVYHVIDNEVQSFTADKDNTERLESFIADLEFVGMFNINFAGGIITYITDETPATQDNDNPWWVPRYVRKS